MGYYVALILLPIFAVLENSLLIDLRALYAPLYGQPSLVLVAVVAWSWHSDLSEAIFWAFIGGIALDILNPIVPMGISVIAPLVMIFAVKAIERLFYQASIFTLIAFIAVGTILHIIVIFVIFNLQGIVIPIGEYVRDYSAITVAFNMIGIMPMYWTLRRIQKRIPQRQNPWAVTPR